SLGPGDHDGNAAAAATPLTINAIRALQQECGTIVVVSAGCTNKGWPQEHLDTNNQRTLIVGASEGDVENRKNATAFSPDDAQIFAPGKDVESTFIYWRGKVAVEASDDPCPACEKPL